VSFRHFWRFHLKNIIELLDIYESSIHNSHAELNSFMTTITKDMGSLQARVPAELIQRLRIEAVRRGVHPRDIVIQALERELPKADQDRTRQRKAS